MVLHVSAYNWYDTDVHSFEWQILNFYDSIVRWTVPVFVMISGSLFLSREIELKKIFSKYIFRIATAFIFWSAVYSLARYVKTGSVIKALATLLGGHYHMWFLFMISGLYMLVPFMKKIAESKFLTKYFLILAFIFAIILPQTITVLSTFYETEKYGGFASRIFNNFHMEFVMGFTGYFLLGYVLNKIKISFKVERVIYFAGIFGFITTIVMSSLASLIKSEAVGFYANMSINVLLESVAVFIFFKKNFAMKSKLIIKLSKYSFGAYLVHDAIISSLRLFGIHSLSFNPVFSVPMISIIVFVISFSISGVLNQIPVLKKYIV